MTSSEPLIDHYLWAAGPVAAQVPPGELVQSRYQVIAPQIWVDTQPVLSTHHLEQLPQHLIPYLRLYSQRLYIPEVYGICQLDKGLRPADILLLENVPVDRDGNLMPSMGSAWTQAQAVRQVYWLWQIFKLWTPLIDLGVASSLLLADNLRVDGWRVRLLELYDDPIQETDMELAPADTDSGILADTGNSVESTVESLGEFRQLSLRDLGNFCAGWCRLAHVSVAEQLQEICQLMQLEETPENEIAQQLNQLLLEQASSLPLRLRVAGGTDTGPQRSHNEDTCYPTAADLPADFTQPSDPLIPHLTLVCDGIGGHEGGEVASQLAVQSLKLQIRAFLTEVAEQTELMTPELVKDQLTAIIRVVNNLICSRNDEQGRESRRRMGTTLVMALQLPQQIHTPTGSGNAHELYLASVGDSRAYWITSYSCQQLTVDDDVAVREVRTGRSLYRQALRRPDAGALTQALGTRDGTFLRPRMQRFIIEEDGLLLLCSDGLSDNNWVEQSWAEYAEPILQSQIPLEAGVQAWIELANKKNGHDNTSVVITHCRVSPEYPVVFNLGEIGNQSLIPKVNLQPELAQSARQTQSTTAKATKIPLHRRFKTPALVLGVIVLLLASNIAGLFTWWKLDPQGFGRMRDDLQKSWHQLMPPTSPAPSLFPSPSGSPIPLTSVPPAPKDAR